jgi:hypothetical protein
MVIALLVSLGLLLSSAPGLEGLVCLQLSGPPPAAGSGSLPLLHTGTPHESPDPASREEKSVSDPEEKEEESHHFFVLETTRMRDRTVPIRRGNPANVRNASGRGLLHQLRHSWQFLC